MLIPFESLCFARIRDLSVWPWCEYKFGREVRGSRHAMVESKLCERIAQWRCSKVGWGRGLTGAETPEMAREVRLRLGVSVAARRRDL